MSDTTVWFLTLIKKYWLRLSSIPIMLIVLSLLWGVVITFLHSTLEVEISPSVMMYTAIPFLAFYFVYVFFCIISNRLPKAHRNKNAVLFVIDAENEKLDREVQYKLVNSFKSIMPSDSSYKFEAIYVPIRRVKKYQLTNKEDAIKLLEKTNCIILVTVYYSADSEENADKYELKINYGICHPTFSKNVEDLLSRDLSTVSSPFRKSRFRKSQKIDVFSLTTQTLLFACQYIVGLVYIILGDYEYSCVLLRTLRNSLVSFDKKPGNILRLKELTDDRLYFSLMRLSFAHMDQFKEGKDIHSLKLMLTFAEEANGIRPDTYEYNLNKAYACIILENDVKKARCYIEKCRQYKIDKRWMFSDAFLCAYLNQSASTIIAKYRRAISENKGQINLIELIDYIEFVIEKEPDKITLHLAAGLLYEAISDEKLMSLHISYYLENTTISNKSAEKLLRSKIGKGCQESEY